MADPDRAVTESDLAAVARMWKKNFRAGGEDISLPLAQLTTPAARHDEFLRLGNVHASEYFTKEESTRMLTGTLDQ